MKISKTKLRQLIREEMSEGRTPSSKQVTDTIIMLFVMSGEVTTTDVFDYLRTQGYQDSDIDNSIDSLGRSY